MTLIYEADLDILKIIIIIIIIHEFHRDASLEQNFRAAVCHVLHYSWYTYIPKMNVPGQSNRHLEPEQDT